MPIVTRGEWPAHPSEAEFQDTLGQLLGELYCAEDVKVATTLLIEEHMYDVAGILHITHPVLDMLKLPEREQFTVGFLVENAAHEDYATRMLHALAITCLKPRRRIYCVLATSHYKASHKVWKVSVVVTLGEGVAAP